MPKVLHTGTWQDNLLLLLPLLLLLQVLHYLQPSAAAYSSIKAMSAWKPHRLAWQVRTVQPAKSSS
jgi:hypothetical protein